jgi:hypothetical protein
MKLLINLLACLIPFLPAPARSAHAINDLKVTALFHFRTNTFAIFENQHGSVVYHAHDLIKTAVNSFAKSDPANSTTVTSIDPRNGGIVLTGNQGESIFKLQQGLIDEGVIFEDASLETFLRIYGEISKRSLLAHPLLPLTTFSLFLNATNQEQFVQSLENDLKRRKIAILSDAPKFVIIVPEQTANDPKIRLARPREDKNAHVFPGELVILHAPLMQVAEMYCLFSDSELDRNSFSPEIGGKSLRFPFTPAGPLSREEILYALRTILYWQSLELVPAGQGKLKAQRVNFPAKKNRTHGPRLRPLVH